MLLEELQLLLDLKLDLEHEVFRKDMLSKSQEEIYKEAYKIAAYRNIHEFISLIVHKFNAEEIKRILFIKNFIQLVYDEWLDYEDSSANDWEFFLTEMIKGLSKTEEVHEENSINS